MSNIEQAQKLIKDIQKKKDIWNERSNFTLKGVKNLSMSDMDSLQLYAETFIRNNGNFYGLMKPLGAIENVLLKYNIKDNWEGTF